MHLFVSLLLQDAVASRPALSRVSSLFGFLTMAAVVFFALFPVSATENEALLLVCNKHEDTMSFVDPVTLRPVEKIPTGHNPHEIILSADRRYAYLSNYAPPGNTISVIDLVNRKHIRQIDTGYTDAFTGRRSVPTAPMPILRQGRAGMSWR